MDRSELLSRLRAVLEGSDPGIVAGYLFGSRARGTEREGSDVDVGILLDGPPEGRLLSRARRLEGELERALGVPVDVVELAGAPPDLVHRVLRDGIVVLDRDRPARLLFEVKARNEYFDILPFLRRYREARP